MHLRTNITTTKKQQQQRKLKSLHDVKVYKSRLDSKLSIYSMQIKTFFLPVNSFISFKLKSLNVLLKW